MVGRGGELPHSSILPESAPPCLRVFFRALRVRGRSQNETVVGTVSVLFALKSIFVTVFLVCRKRSNAYPKREIACAERTYSVPAFHDRFDRRLPRR